MSLADKDGFVAEGKSRPRIRRGVKAISAAQQRKFLETLAETCNVLLSATKAGVRPQRFYDLKARDASFRAGWDQALAAGYAELELMMLGRALHGVEKVIKLPGGTSTAMREFSDRLGLALLKMHREGASIAAASGEVEMAEQEEICDRIMERLDRLRTRDIDKIEIKSAPGRLAMIEWGLTKGRLAR